MGKFNEILEIIFVVIVAATMGRVVYMAWQW